KQEDQSPKNEELREKRPENHAEDLGNRLEPERLVEAEIGVNQEMNYQARGQHPRQGLDRSEPAREFQTRNGIKILVSQPKGGEESDDTNANIQDSSGKLHLFIALLKHVSSPLCFSKLPTQRSP